jgi:serine/threonine-protein kinase
MTQPAQLGRYDVVAEIGRGAMGVVYRAVDPMLERTVAVKTINMALDPGEMEQYEKRFTIEARAAGGLNHPNIVIIYDIGRSGDLAYMAMEFLEGRELKELIAANELTPDRSLDIVALVADGLAYAHAHEVVHRDVKPANIMILNDGRVKITGLRHRANAHRRRAHPDRRRARLATLSVAGTGAGQALRCSRRYLLARRDPLRDGHRPGAVQRH